jgi:hypothetical protein
MGFAASKEAAPKIKPSLRLPVGRQEGGATEARPTGVIRAGNPVNRSHHLQDGVIRVGNLVFQIAVQYY